MVLQCRSAFGGPVDPHLVLGGFPMDSSFQSYSADATSFVVTYPIDSSPDNRCNAHEHLGFTDVWT
jgi:Niemann-Pick C1 protein